MSVPAPLVSQVSHYHTQYQRDDVRERLVLEIASRFSWKAFGCLHVADRGSAGMFFVFDGQTRLRAANKRDEIRDLPCMIFADTSESTEARAFVDVNTGRSPVKAFHKWRAKLVAGDPVAAAIKQMVQASGYRVTSCGNVDFTVCCVSAIEKCMTASPELCERVWGLATQICNGKPIHDRLVLGLFAAEKFLARSKCDKSLFDHDVKTRLIACGDVGLNEEIARVVNYRNKGGEASYGQGVINAANFRRREANKLPGMIA